MTVTTYPNLVQYLPKGSITSGKYIISFARNQEELEELLTLRYEVFNLEMGEGLDESFESGMDKDEFDDPNVVHISEDPDPVEDIEIIQLELTLSDLEQINNKI